MKTKILIAIAAVSAALAASDPVVTTKLVRIQCDPASNTSTGFFEQKTVIDNQTYTAPWTSVNWAIDSTRTVVVDGKTYTYAEVSAAVFAIAEQERTNPTPPTPPSLPMTTPPLPDGVTTK